MPKIKSKLYLEDVSENPCEHCAEAHYVTCGWCDKKKRFKQGISILKIQNLIKRIYFGYLDRCELNKEMFSAKEFSRLAASSLLFLAKDKRGK